jgi:hypothetical protein
VLLVNDLVSNYIISLGMIKVVLGPVASSIQRESSPSRRSELVSREVRFPSGTPFGELAEVLFSFEENEVAGSVKVSVLVVFQVVTDTIGFLFFFFSDFFFFFSFKFVDKSFIFGFWATNN